LTDQFLIFTLDLPHHQGPLHQEPDQPQVIHNILY